MDMIIINAQTPFDLIQQVWYTRQGASQGSGGQHYCLTARKFLDQISARNFCVYMFSLCCCMFFIFKENLLVRR